jgi:signal transduction histidine kinase/CheY-like chemotaxis protein
MINSLRYRLLAWLLSFVLLTFVFVIPSVFIYQYKTKKISSVVQQINLLNINFLKDSKVISDFMLIESKNPEFYITGQSRQLMEHYKIKDNIAAALNTVYSDDDSRILRIESEFNQLRSKLKEYNTLFDSLVYLTYKRGYGDFGLEGELNDCDRRLEQASFFSKLQLFQLRKSEIAYLKWHDRESLELFRKTTSGLYASVQNNRSVTADHRQLLYNLLENNKSAFERLVNIDEKIGLTGNTELHGSMNEKNKEIEALFLTLLNEAGDLQQILIRRLNLFYIAYLGMIILLSLVAGFVISKHVVSHLEKLTVFISSVAQNKIIPKPITHGLDHSAREITAIYLEFRELMAQVDRWKKQHNIALKKVEENQKRYQELADLLPQSIFEADLDGNYTYANKAWFHNFRYSRSDLKNGIDVRATLISETIHDILNASKLEDAAFIAIRKDQTRFEASVYADDIIKDGQITGKRGIVIDISDKNRYIRKLKHETSKAQTSDQLKSSFLANMSHEIRTPMNSIIGFSNLLASEEVPEDQKKEFVHYIQTSGEILLNLVDDIIDIAKIEAGELKITKKECNLTALLLELHQTFNEIKIRLNKPSLKLIVSPEKENENLIFKTDPFRLRQILSNLIGNAIKFTDEGCVEFGYKVASQKKIEFYVKDTGIGLTREEMDMIFERFKRSHHSEERNIKGTGLGLTIAKNLVELLGGELWVESSPGNGTTFYFTIPYLKITKSIPPEVKELSDSDYNWEGKTILIVEDDLHGMSYLVELLKKTRVSILQAFSGDMAVELCKNHHPDLVIMDIQLPGMDGLEATRIIKQMNARLPVIAQTAFAMAGDRERIKQAGCDDYLAKPIDSKQLLPRINDHLKIYQDKTSSVPSLDMNRDWL